MINHGGLVILGRELKFLKYNFTTVTPETHRLYIKQNLPMNKKNILRDLLGWSLEVPHDYLSSSLLDLLTAAQVLEVGDKPGHVRSTLRASTLEAQLFWHSAYPTTQADSVFFGPDSYRFVRFLKSKIHKARHIVDLGCGTGVGGLTLQDRASEITLSDINESALSLAKANSEINLCKNVTIVKRHFLRHVSPGADWVIANPPFIMDDCKRAYRDGGGEFGSELSIQMVKNAMEYLEPGGRLAMYTGACVVNGEDRVLKALRLTLKDLAQFNYEEIDPDIFGEELSSPSFKGVERIAAVGIVAIKS